MKKFKFIKGEVVAGLKVLPKHNPRARNAHWDTEGNLYLRVFSKPNKKEMQTIRNVMKFIEKTYHRREKDVL